MTRSFPRFGWIPALLWLALPGTLLAQSGSSGLALEINRYYGEQERALVEGAVEIPYPLLTFSASGESLRAKAKVEVAIEKPDGGQVYHTEHDISPEAVNADMAASRRVSSIETFAVYAPPGAYTARARVTDEASGKSYEITAPLEVPADRPYFSDVLLSNNVQKDVRLQEGTYLPYLIGTTMFNPNPRNAFYKDSPLLYFYYEVNPEDAAEGQTVDLHMTVTQPDGSVIKDLGERKITVAEGRNFDLGAFNIGGLVPGRYELRVSCESCSEPARLASAFEVMPPHQERIAFLPSDSAGGGTAPANLQYYADLSPAQVDSVVSALDIWFTPAQKQLLSTLNNTGKVQFLNRWWDSMDTDPSTEANEAKQVIEQRIAYADQFFTSSQRLGRDTDRGRIYMLFGEPTEKFDRPVEATLGAYVIWNYSNQGKTFAFGDFRNDGDFKLIYSTDPRFTGDPAIQSQVDQSPTNSRESFLKLGRGYEQIIEDIRTHRVSTGFNP